MNDLHVPTGDLVSITLRTDDVQHAFFVPELRVKQDAVPSKLIPVWFDAHEASQVRNVVCRALRLGALQDESQGGRPIRKMISKRGKKKRPRNSSMTAFASRRNRQESVEREEVTGTKAKAGSRFVSGTTERGSQRRYVETLQQRKAD